MAEVKAKVESTTEALFLLTPNTLGEFSLQEQTKGAVQEAKRQADSFESLAQEIVGLIKQKTSKEHNYNELGMD